jgi:3-oxoacyl-[acyl-carrier protein] reductase
MDLELKGKVACVTGAGQGVGRRIALDLATEGARVIVNDLFEDRARAVCSEISAAGGWAEPMPVDVASRQEVSLALVRAAAAAGGPVQVLVNNAGIPPRRREAGGMPPLFSEMPPEDWNELVDINLYGTLNFCHAVLPGMRLAGGGRIVSIISEAGRIGEARLAVYSAAKAAMLGFTKALAQEVGRDCINVNVVALGAVSHEGIKAGALRPDATPENDERLAKMLNAYPIARGLRRLCRPEDVSGMVLFLASSRASFITGQSIGVSGGYAMP